MTTTPTGGPLLLPLLFDTYATATGTIPFCSEDGTMVGDMQQHADAFHDGRPARLMTPADRLASS